MVLTFPETSSTKSEIEPNCSVLFFCSVLFLTVVGKTMSSPPSLERSFTPLGTIVPTGVRLLERSFTPDVRLLERSFTPDVRLLERSFTPDVRLLERSFTPDVRLLELSFTPDVRVARAIWGTGGGRNDAVRSEE